MPWAAELTVTVVAVKDGRADVERGIESARRSLDRAGATVRDRIFRGEPTDELLRYLGDHETDLVVLGATALTGLQRLALDSPANVVAHATQHSILLACETARTVVTEASTDRNAEHRQWTT